MNIHLFFAILTGILIPTLFMIEFAKWGYPIIAITLALSNICLLYIKKRTFNKYIDKVFILINLVFIICIIKNIYSRG